MASILLRKFVLPSLHAKNTLKKASLTKIIQPFFKDHNSCQISSSVANCGKRRNYDPHGMFDRTFISAYLSKRITYRDRERLIKIKIHPKDDCMKPIRDRELKLNDHINIFRRPELLEEFTDHKLIEKHELEEVTKGYRLADVHNYFISSENYSSFLREYSIKKVITKDDNSTEELKEPNPEDKSQKKPHNSMFSLTKSEQNIDMEGVSDYKFTTREYVSRDGTKKRLTAIAVECYNPVLKHENFEPWYLMDFRTKRVSNFIPSFAKSCIKIVGDVEDLTKTLDDFTKICDKSIYVAKDKDGKFVKTNDKDEITNSTITLPGRPAYKLVRKSKVKTYIKDFKKQKIDHFFIMPGGEMTLGGLCNEDEKFCDYKISKRCYISKSDAENKLTITNVDCKNPDLLNHPNFEKYWMAYHYTGVDLEEDNSYEKPLYTKFCYRILDDFQKIYYEPMSLPKNAEKSEAMARIQYSECNHYKDRDTKAIYMAVTASCESKELKKLENLGFLQIYSAKKQPLIDVDQILAKMKTMSLEDSYSSEFLIRDFSEIKKDKLLKLKEVLKEKESVFSKSSNGKWKFLFERKKKSVMPSAPYIVCQQLQYESKEECNEKFYVLKIIETTDKELEQFVGKAFLQKVNDNQLTITKPNTVLNYMINMQKHDNV